MIPEEKKRLAIAGAVVAVAIVAGAWFYYLYFERPTSTPPKQETITKAIKRLAGIEDENEIFVQILTEEGFKPGTVFHRARRQVFARPEESDIKLESTSPQFGHFLVHEVRQAETKGDFENDVFLLAGQMSKNGIATFECDNLTFLRVDDSPLQSWIDKSKHAIQDAMANKDWDKEPPLIVYRTIIGKYKLTIEAFHDDISRVQLKEIGGMKGGLSDKLGDKKVYKFECDRPLIIAFCARRLTRDLKLGTAEPPRLGPRVKTDHLGSWENLPLIKQE